MLFSHHSHDALFLDVDHTLLDAALTPDRVRVPCGLIELLYRLSETLDGALALISGRPIADVDRLLTPYRFATLGGHGCELRISDGALRVAHVDAQAVNFLHDECCRFVGDALDLLVEYKPCGVAIHFRLAPGRGMDTRHFMEALAQRAGAGFSVIEGQFVWEIKPTAYSGATAVMELLEAPPFRGRRPIYIGGTLAQGTFAAVNSVGGITIEVSTYGPTIARLRIANIPSVRTVLEFLLKEYDCNRKPPH